MGSLLRSEEMAYVRLYFDQVAAHDTLAELARSEIIQLEDLNQEVSSFQKEAAGEIRRCEEMLRRIRYLDEQAKSYKEDEHYRYSTELEDRRIMSPKKLEDLDEFLCTMEHSVKQITTHEESIEGSYEELNEMRLVLEACEDVLRDTNRGERGFVTSLVKQMGALTPAAANAFRELSEQSRTYSGKGLVNFIAGMIDTERRAAFERTTFRVTKGNCFVKSEDVSGGRTLFIVFLTGSKVRSKVERTCTAFQAARYPIPEDSEEREKSHGACIERLRELELVITATKASRAEIIRNYRDYLDIWRDFVEDEKTILQASNKLNYDTSRSLFIAEGWVASTDMEEFTACIKRGQLSSNAQAPSLVEVRGVGKSQGEPPTYFRINKFTSVFQAIIESYGIAQYEEMNPAPFAVITFPFLFAVMFGDVGHGVIMACFALILIIFERAFQNGPKRSEFFAYCFNGRYIIFLMGLFSIFTGFIYNEVFAVPMNIFVSRYDAVRE
uniref:V-type proton ATPase subunit a n=1 Tax=Rhodosorus marinus TaxID=101924 RepID=A0A7S3A8N9_9RHOD